MPDSKKLFVNVICPPGQVGVLTLWDRKRIVHAIHHPVEDGNDWWIELEGIDERGEPTFARARANTILSYTITAFHGQSQIAVPRLVPTDRKVQ